MRRAVAVKVGARGYKATSARWAAMAEQAAATKSKQQQSSEACGNSGYTQGAKLVATQGLQWQQEIRKRSDDGWMFFGRPDWPVVIGSCEGRMSGSNTNEGKDIEKEYLD
uniref:Uncharacterized protein n=1 Tax=Ananas comosus var. bracteatus TaxID=296719 RepID=A0A6V7P2H8_ANACO|nr:unnamed protein product [Ananas comosus var. bracteatus]